MSDLYNGDVAHKSFSQSAMHTGMHRSLVDRLKRRSSPTLTEEAFHDLDSVMKLGLLMRSQASAPAYVCSNEEISR